MDSVYLKTLVKVFQTRSFTKAAEKLRVTQSAVSRRIQFMESQYGCTLVDRSGPLLKPTPEGRLVFEKALKIIEIEKDLDLELSKIGKEEEFSFICSPVFNLVHLPEIMGNFIRCRPYLSNLKFISEVPENIMKAMNEGLYEIAVMEHCQNFDLGGFGSINLPGDEIIFAASPQLGFHPGEATLEELFRHTLFTRKSGNCSRALLEENLEGKGRSLKDFSRVVVVDDLDTLNELIVNGHGIAFISNELVGSLIAQEYVAKITVPGFVHRRKRTLVFSPTSSDCPHMDVFINQILDHFDVSRGKKRAV